MSGPVEGEAKCLHGSHVGMAAVHVMQCSAVQCSAVQCSEVQCSATFVVFLYMVR